MSYREATAWHEAGHLAAAVLLGTARSASIKPGHWHTGQAEVSVELDPAQLEAAWWDAVLGQPVNPQLRGQVERVAIIRLAGYVTEVRAAERDLYTAKPPPDPSSPAERTRFGRVRVYASGEPGAALLHTATIPDVRAELESGLMGIAVRGTSVFGCASRDPGDDWRIELLRSTLAADGSLGPFEVMPIGEMTGAPRHQGCAVQVDATDHLWLTVGDANLPAGENRAQDPNRLNGKVLRLQLDGSVPDDNPFGSAVYSLGHRNPQGLAFAPDGGIWEVEHGTDENDEINLLRSGGNYGYPCFTGADATGPIPDGCGRASDYLAPAWASGSTTLATSGATFLVGAGWRDWDGDLMVSTLKEEDLRRFSVDSDGDISFEETMLDGRFGRLRALVIGPDGALYASTANGDDDRILRFTR